MKKIVNPKDYLLPFKITFPEGVEIMVNGLTSRFSAGKEIELNTSEFQAVKNSSYGKYIRHILRQL